MHTNFPVSTMVLGFVNEGDVMPLYFFSQDLRMNAEVMERAVKLWTAYAMEDLARRFCTIS